MSEAVTTPPTSGGTIEAVAPEPAFAKGNAKPNSKRIFAPPKVAVKRKPGRPREATA